MAVGGVIGRSFSHPSDPEQFTRCTEHPPGNATQQRMTSLWGDWRLGGLGRGGTQIIKVDGSDLLRP